MKDVSAVRTEAGPSRASRTEMGHQACSQLILATAIAMLTPAAVGESVSARACRLSCIEAPPEPQKMENLGESRWALISTARTGAEAPSAPNPHWRFRRPAEGDRGAGTRNIRCARPPGAAYSGAVQTGEGLLGRQFRMTSSSHPRESRPLNTSVCAGRSPLRPVPLSAPHRAEQGFAARP